MLTMLPFEMEAIRASPETMLVREELYEKKRKSKSPIAETESAPRSPMWNQRLLKTPPYPPKMRLKK